MKEWIVICVFPVSYLVQVQGFFVKLELLSCFQKISLVFGGKILSASPELNLSR